MTWQIHRFATVPSTMDLAAPMPVGSVVVADEQTAGIGRHGHAWDSEKSVGLYVSMVLAPHPVLTLALGLAAQSALRQVTSLDCDIRWPNDLMLSRRKLGGILVHMQSARAIAGVGINVAQTRFPEDLSALATSLLLETGLEFRRDDLLQALLGAVDAATSLTQEEVLEQWQARSTWGRGKAVQIDNGERVITGVTAGLDESGFLLVRTPDDTIETIIAGGVREA